MDEVIFEEFKGTGNRNCVGSKIADKRIYPAIDITNGTRRRIIIRERYLQKMNEKNNCSNGNYGCY